MIEGARTFQSANSSGSEDPRSVSGFLLVHKPSGITSFDVIRQLRRILGIKKLGHSGVLDRPASGLLVVGVNKATRLFELFSDFEKEYEADVWLGLNTSTDDLTGELLQIGQVADVTEQTFTQALSKYRGTFAQVPPAFSLAKKAGKESYRYALAGEAVEIEARQVTIHDSKLLAFESAVDPAVALSEEGTCAAEGKLAVSAEQLPQLARAKVWLQCSGGLYVRSLARDIGSDLGCGATMGRLLRTRVGPFKLAESQTLAGLEALLAKGSSLAAVLQPLSSIAAEDSRLELDATQIEMVGKGQAISSSAANLRSHAQLFGVSELNELVCILERGEATHAGLVALKPVKVFR
jgi:tRNA pseudouridine55 synthase